MPIFGKFRKLGVVYLSIFELTRIKSQSNLNLNFFLGSLVETKIVKKWYDLTSVSLTEFALNTLMQRAL